MPGKELKKAMSKAISFLNNDVKIPLKIPVVDYSKKETNVETKPTEQTGSGFLGSIGLSRYIILDYLINIINIINFINFIY